MPSHPADGLCRELVVGAHQRPCAGQTVATYTRTIHQQEVTFTCAECGRTRTQIQYPGGRPRQYCNVLCAQAGQRRLAADRKRRQRARQQTPQRSGTAI